jgi:phosphate/sulfate permease
MNSEQFTKLEKIIAKGKWHYIIVNGVLGWGVSTAVLFSLFQSFTSEQFFTDVIGLSIILFPLAGVGWGLFIWFYINKQYCKFKSPEL